MNPLLHRIEALPGDGEYAVSFLLDGARALDVVMRVRDGSVDVPEANLAGMSLSAESLEAVRAAVAAVDDARRSGGPRPEQLRDVPGGWDVGLGNVVLSPAGLPSCVAHGDMEQTDPPTWACATCGSLALYGA